MDFTTYAILKKLIKKSNEGFLGDYNDLEGKPSINGKPLQGNLTTEDLNITKESIGLEKVENVAVNDQTPTFSKASSRQDINSGDTLSTLFSKIAKWLGDLKTVAFTGSYENLSDKPESLKNPNSLKITGAVDITYDGSESQTIEIPTSLPADGGNADTLDDKHAEDFQTPTGDTAENIVTFSSAEQRENIVSGDDHKTIFGKIAKYFDDMSNVAFTGKFSDLSDAPEINDGSLKIQKNGEDIETFTANQKGEVVANIEIPTKLSEFENDEGFKAYEIATESENGLMSSDDKKKLEGIDDNANDYTHPTGEGYEHLPSGGAEGQILVKGTDDAQYEWQDPGSALPEGGTEGQVLKKTADGYEWSDDSNTTYGDVTTETNGLMIAADKKKLDEIDDKANFYEHPETHSIDMITESETKVVMTFDEREKLTGIEEGAQVNTITGVKGESEEEFRTGQVEIKKSDLGLGNVEDKSAQDIISEITDENIVSSLGYTPEATKQKISYTLLSTGWTGESFPYLYVVDIEGLTEEQDVYVCNDVGLTEEQIDGFIGACIIGNKQEEGKITLQAKYKPTTDLPIIIKY